MSIGTKPLPPIAGPPAGLAPDLAASGVAVPPIERLRHMDAQAWQDFIFEWAHSLKAQYARVELCGGAGDMGRDVVAFESATTEDPWDNHQCKHYDHALTPTDVWPEIGKLYYHTFRNEYSLPRRYVFVAPRGAGNALSKLLRSPALLRQGVVGAWEKHCRHSITSTTDVVLQGALKAYVESADFSIFSAASPLTIIEDHQKTPWHTYRFGGGLPPRGAPPSPPTTIGVHETTYVRALLDAYEERLGVQLADAQSLADAPLAAHFSRSRHEFYSAESLREFSRDSAPSGTFEHYLDEVHNGVLDVVQAQHQDAYERVLAVVKQAKALQLTANALVSRTTTMDRGGMCHQLANDFRLKWRP